VGVSFDAVAGAGTVGATVRGVTCAAGIGAGAGARMAHAAGATVDARKSRIKPQAERA